MPEKKGSGGSRAPAGAFGASRPPAADKPAAPEPTPVSTAPKPAAAEPDLAPHKGNPAPTAADRPSQAPGDAPLPRRVKQPSRQPTLGGQDSGDPGAAALPPTARPDTHKPTLIGRISSPEVAPEGVSPQEASSEKPTLMGRSSAPAATPVDHGAGEKSTLIGRKSSTPPAPAAMESAPPGKPSGTLVGGPVPKTVHEDMIARARSQRGSYPSPPSWDEVRESLAPQHPDSRQPQPRPASVPPEVAELAAPAEPEVTEPRRPAARTMPQSEVTQLGIPLDNPAAPPPAQAAPPPAQAAAPAAPAAPSAPTPASVPPEAYDDEIEEGIELEELRDSDPPSSSDDGMDIDLLEDPLGAVGAPRVVPPSPLGAADTPALLEVSAPERAADATPVPDSEPPFESLAPLPQTRSEPPDPIPSVIVQPSAPPTVGLAAGPAPTPLLAEEVAREDDGSPVLGALLVVAALMLAVGGWYFTRGGFTPTKPKPSTLAPSAAKAPAKSAPAKAVAPAAPTVPPPRVAPGGTTDGRPGANAALRVPEPAASPKRSRPQKRRPGSAPAYRPPPPAAAQPEPAAPAPEPAPIVTIGKRAPVIAIKPAGAPAGPSAPPAVVDPASRPNTPTRKDVKRAFESVHAQVRGCSRGRGGVADVDLTVLSSGHVSFAKVGGDYAGTPEGSCMARAIRKARFAPFKREKFRIIYPIAL